MNEFAALFSILASTLVGPTSLQDISPQDMINWKVGDEATFSVSGGMFGKLGTLYKAVTKDEGDALWMVQDMDMKSQREKVEILIRKSDAVVLRVIRNGKEQELPKEEPPKIRKQETTRITVPAGKFDCAYVLLDTKDVKGLEIWANPMATPMEGTLKTTIPTQMMKVTMVLETFKKQP